MYIAILIGGVLLLLILGIILVRNYRKRKAAASDLVWEQGTVEIRAWLDRYEQARYEDDQALANVGPPPDGWLHWERVTEALEYQQKAIERLRAEKAARRAMEQSFREFKLMADPLELTPVELKRLYNGTYLLQAPDSDWLGNELKKLFVAKADQFVEAARQGDLTAVSKLELFINDYHYRHCTGSRFVYPEDWNTLIAMLFENPHYDNFKSVGEFASGDVRLLAAKALESESIDWDFALTNAKIVLALCNDQKYWLAEVDDLAGQLAKMIVRIQAHKGLVFQVR